MYQASNMGTPKWHVLDHLIVHLKEIGVIACLNCSLFKQAHDQFKKDYNMTSKEPEIVMPKVSGKQELGMRNELYSSQHCLKKVR